MSFSANTDNFPSLSQYAHALKHYDSVKPYRGYCESDPRSIGVRSHKNKQMRKLADGSIAFRLYNTDCVIYHPDDTITVEGYSSMSTSAFISCLVPRGIRHRQGSWRVGGPVLELRPDRSIPYWFYDEHNNYKRNPEYNRDTVIVNCSRPVRLHYSADRWLPVDVDALESFSVPRIDRSQALKVSREYRLPEFEAWLQMITVCKGELALPEVGECEGDEDDVLEQLKLGNFIEAAKLIPRGEVDRHNWRRIPFGRKPVAADAPRPGFIANIRKTLYENEGVIGYRKEPMISVSAYERLKRDR